MATAKINPEEKPPEEESRQVTFLCKFCGQSRPLEDMRVLTRFFPLLVVCRDCERVMR